MKILINQDQLNVLILEQVSGPGGYMVTATDNRPSTQSVRNFQDVLKEKNMTLDSFIESFREKLYSPAGMAIEAFLSAFGVPEIPMVAYAGLTTWDVYQSIAGKTMRWGDLIFDLLGLISSGVISGALAPFRSMMRPAKSLSEAVEILKKTKIWSKIFPLIQKLGNSIKIVLTSIGKGLKWLSEKLGLKYLTKFISQISSFIEKNITELVSKLGGTEKLAKSSGVGTKTFAQQSALMGTINKGMETYQNTKGTKVPPNIDFKYKPTQAEIDNVSKIDFSS